MKQKIAYNTEEAAEQVSVSMTTLRRAVENGDLTPRYYGSRLLFSHKELEEWILSLPSEKS